MKFKVFVSFLCVLVQTGCSMPQLFSQGLTIPKIASWDPNERQLSILPNFKVASPIKTSHINIFGKKNTVNKKPTKDQLLKGLGQSNEEFKTDRTAPIITKQQENGNQSNDIQSGKLPIEIKQTNELISKFNDLSENESDNLSTSNGAETTTELSTETTTDGGETTTFSDFEIFNRASPQLVASLLG